MRLNLVNFLDEDWEYDYKRPHLEGLAKYVKMLCVEPPMSLDTPFRRPSLFLDWLKRRTALRRIGHTLWLYKPVALVPYSVSLRLPLFKKANRAILKASLRNVLKLLRMTDLVVMILHPAQDYVIGMLGKGLALELGCGTGGMVRILAQRFEGVLGRAYRMFLALPLMRLVVNRVGRLIWGSFSVVCQRR